MKLFEVATFKDQYSSNSGRISCAEYREISCFLTPRGENLGFTPSPRFYPEISAHYNMKFIEEDEIHILYNNCGSILGKGKKCFFSAQRPDGN